MASSTWAARSSRAAREAIGPSRVSSLVGSPRRQDLAASTNPSRNSSQTAVSTMNPHGRGAGLSGVAEPARGGGPHGLGNVGVAENDERVGPSEFEHAFLQVPPGQFTDRDAGPFGTGERDALDDRAGDHSSDLLVGGEHVGVDAFLSLIH